MNSFIIILISFLFSFSGLDLVNQMENLPKPDDVKSNITLQIKRKKTKTLSFRSIIKDNGKKQIMWFTAPPSDKGVSFLKIEKENKSEDMRMWLPAFKKIRRISSKKKGDSFMGSDLSYEDLSNRNLNDNKYIRLEDETVDEINCYVLEIRPIGNIKTSYSKHISCINKSTLVTKKEKSYDKKGNLIKDKSFDYIFVEGYSVLNYVFIKNVQKNHTTQVYFSEIVLNSKIDEDIFNEKSLQNMPVD